MTVALMCFIYIAQLMYIETIVIYITLKHKCLTPVHLRVLQRVIHIAAVPDLQHPAQSCAFFHLSDLLSDYTSAIYHLFPSLPSFILL